MFEQTTQPMGAPMGFGAFGAPMMQYNGIAPQAMPKFNNLLTEEQIKELQTKREDFSLTITNDEHLRALCNHRSADGMSDTIQQDPTDGSYVCAICGHRFRPVDYTITKDNIEEVCNSLKDILQTIKLMYRDFPVDAAGGFFDIIPLISKVPGLFDVAAKNLQKYEQAGGNPYYNMNQSQGALQALQGLSNVFGGGFGYFGGVAPQPQAPMGTMGAPAAPQFGNPFGYPGAGAANPYAAATTGFQYTPGAAVPQPAAAPAADASATTTTKQNVQA